LKPKPEVNEDFFTKMFNAKVNPAIDRRARQDKVVDFMSNKFLSMPESARNQPTGPRLNSAEEAATEMRNETDARRKVAMQKMRTEQAAQISTR